MRGAWLAAALFAASSAAGIRFQDPPYRAVRPGMPADSYAFIHRDSPYTHVAWVVSQSANHMSLLFFDASQGGVCLNPRWEGDPALADRPINPGTLTSSMYALTFPAAALLNRSLMSKAGGDPAKAAPRVLIVGLGAGAGIAVLAHHFPEASLTVVDIDPVVIQIAEEGYPYLRWLRTQKTTDGRPRLREVAMDARQFIRQAGREGERFDLVVMDAFTLGLTVPPHLLTREFFRETAACMDPDGVMITTIHASYSGKKAALFGGALRTMQAAGFKGIHTLPVHWFGEQRDHLQPEALRNCMVLAAREGISPDERPDRWARVLGWKPYADLPTGKWVNRSLSLANSERFVSAKISLDDPQHPLDPSFLELLDRGMHQTTQRFQAPGGHVAVSNDRVLIGMAGDVVKRAYGGRAPLGWDKIPAEVALVQEETDWVQLARDSFRYTAQLAGAHSVAPPEAADALDEDDVRVGVWFPNGLDGQPVSWIIRDAPLFTDARPNADIANAKR